LDTKLVVETTYLEGQHELRTSQRDKSGLEGVDGHKPTTNLNEDTRQGSSNVKLKVAGHAAENLDLKKRSNLKGGRLRRRKVKQALHGQWRKWLCGEARRKSRPWSEKKRDARRPGFREILRRAPVK
jgi:hypothetical protein